MESYVTSGVVVIPLATPLPHARRSPMILPMRKPPAPHPFKLI